MSENLISDLERELELRQANGEETLKLERAILLQKSLARQQDTEDAEENYKQQYKLLDKQIKEKERLLKTSYAKNLFKQQWEKELRSIGRPLLVCHRCVGIRRQHRQECRPVDPVVGRLDVRPNVFLKQYRIRCINLEED